MPTRNDLKLPESAELPHELREELDRELREDEVIYWVGQPEPAVFAKRIEPMQALACVIMFVLLLMVVAGVILRAAGVNLGTEQDPSPPFSPSRDLSILAVCLATGLLVGYAIFGLWPRHERRVAARTAYAVTDARGIVLQLHSKEGTTKTDIPPSVAAYMTRRERPDGVGDLTFEVSAERTTHTITAGFFAIPDVRGVQRLLQNLFLLVGEE